MNRHRKRQTFARNFRFALVTALSDPELAAMLARVGVVRSGRRIVQGGLPSDPRTAADLRVLLTRILRALQAGAGAPDMGPRVALQRKIDRAQAALADLRRAVPLARERFHDLAGGLEYELAELL